MSAMTIVEKVLAKASSTPSVRPGEIVVASVDLAVANDITAPLAFRQIEAAGGSRVFDPARIAVVAGRHAPFRNAQIADSVSWLERFCARQGIGRVFTNGEGMDHVLLPEAGHITPGTLVLNGDSHAATIGALGAIGVPMGSTDMSFVFAFGETWLRVPETLLVEFNGTLSPGVVSKDLILEVARRLGSDGAAHCAIEFSGDTIDAMSVEERFTLPNMSIELGADTGVIATDAKTRAYLSDRNVDVYDEVFADPDAQYSRTIRIDVSDLQPQVALPNSPDGVVPIGDAEDVKLTQVNIGTCTNGRLTDLRQAAAVLKGRKVASGVRLHITPATRRVYADALREGLIEVFHDAGATINPPGCGACAGWHMGALGSDDVCLATHNRNFKGRMGHRDAQIYLSSPYVAAASAIVGKITDPRSFL